MKRSLKEIQAYIEECEQKRLDLTTSKFKFLDVKNYIGPGLSYDAWCKSMGCRLQKLMFPYKWLDSIQIKTFTVTLNLPLQEIIRTIFETV